MKLRRVLIAAAVLLAAGSVWAADTAPATVSTPAAKTVTINAANTPVEQVMKDISAATGETILVEKLVSGKLTMNLTGVSTESALNAATKILKLQWRKVYVSDGSVLAKDADALAEQMRTVLSVRFPDIIIAEDGAGGSFMHIQRETAANQIIKIIPPAAGFKVVYLITDDEKAYKKEIKDESKKKVSNYVTSQKELLQSFLKMSPEERKAALRESMSMMSQMDPKMMAEMMNSIAEQDPEFLTRQGQMNMQALMNMNPEARRNLLRLSIKSNMEVMKNMPPEFMKELQEESAAIAAEMGAGQSGAQNQPSTHLEE